MSLSPAESQLDEHLPCLLVRLLSNHSALPISG